VRKERAYALKTMGRQKPFGKRGFERAKKKLTGKLPM